MKYINKSIGSFLLLFSALFATTFCFAAPDPVNKLNSIADQLINRLKQNRTTLRENPSLVYSIANQVVVPQADISEMSRRVVPPAVWNKASPSQRARFGKAFTNLLVHTYASALANYNDQTVHFFPVRGGYEGKNSIQVSSSIERSDGPSISVTYRMILRGAQWKLYDMSVEGVSMLGSFRSQFSDLLSTGDMEALINKLNAHNAGA